MISIVVADDEPSVRESIERILTEHISGIHVDASFDNGLDLLTYMNTHPIDLLITDIEMPGASGLDIARKIRDSGNNTHIVFITAYQKFEYAHMAVQYKVDEFLLKPLSSKMIIDTIQHIVNGIRAKKRNPSNDNTWHYVRQTIQLICMTQSTAISSDITFPGSSHAIWDVPCAQIQCIIHNWSELSYMKQAELISLLATDIAVPTQQMPCIFLDQRNGQFNYIMLYHGHFDQSHLLRLLENNALHIEVSNVETLITLHTSFRTFREHLGHQFLLTEYTKNANQNGVSFAEVQLRSPLQQMNEDMRQDFVRYLESELSLSGIDPTPEGISRALEQNYHTRSTNTQTLHLVDAAKKYVRAHYSSPSLSLQEVADALNVSTYHLSRKFKEIRGISFIAYCQHVRMEKAIELLRTTTYSINEIAVRVGYGRGNTVYFRTTFKNMYGITPRQYRESLSSERK